MKASRSPYDVLDVELTATAAEIQQAFKDALRSRKHPPQEVRHAYEQLRHPRSRLRCDLLEPGALDPRTGGDDPAAAADPRIGPVPRDVVPPFEFPVLS